MGPAASPLRALCFFSLLLETLLLVLSGDIILQVQGAQREVNGLVGGSVLLSVPVTHNRHVLDVRWKFGPTNVRLGDSKGRKFVPYNLSYAKYSQMILKMDMYDETTLRIRNLTKGDGGVYKADVQLKDGTSSEVEFQLSVYDPVPAPRIQNESFIVTGGCNVTLHCQIPNGGDLHLKWFMGNSNSSRQDQYISDGNMLNLSINSNISDSKYLCVASNPVDTKNATISLACPEAVILGTHWCNWIYACLAIPGVFILLIPICVCIWKKMRKRNHEGDCPEGGYVASARTDEPTGPEHANGISEASNGIDQAQTQSENRTSDCSKEEPVYLDVLKS